MPDEIYEQSFVGRKPAWHGKGTALGKMFSSKEVMQYSGQDFIVEKIPMDTRDGQAVDSVRATVRTDKPVGHPDRILGVVGSKYEVVQNHEAFDFFDEVCGPDSVYYVSAGVLGHGERTFLVAELPLELWVKRDQYKHYVVLMNAHDYSSSWTVLATSVCVVCQNTLSKALVEAKNYVALRHTKNIHNRLRDAPALLGLADKSFHLWNDMFKLLAKRPVTHPLFQQYLEDVFPTTGKKVNARTLAHREKVAEMVEMPRYKWAQVDGTWYAALSAVTEYVDHVVVRKRSKFETAILGGDNQLKHRALKLALEGAK